MKHIKLGLILLFSVLTASCSGVIGYSVVLWNIPEREIADGTIVPVYIKSSISKEYVIGVPGNEAEKISVPLWKLSSPVSKARAKQQSVSYIEYEHTYARCTFDGLPIREKPLNISKQAYRLRKDEVIRVLGKGEGEAPTSGSTALEGEWLSVLTADGTLGWCFSHNLALFSMNADGSYNQNNGTTGLAEQDNLLEAVLAAKWYPDYYVSLIRAKTIDLYFMHKDYGFDTGSTTGSISINLSDLNAEFPFAGVERTGNKAYKFTDTPIQMTVRNENSISISYMDEQGKPISKNFVTIDEDVPALIQKEEERRSALYESLRTASRAFTSSSYGTLSFTGGEGFTWKGYSMLVPSVIEANAGQSGSVSVKYLLPKNLSSSWDALLTFKFSSSQSETHFLSRLETNGLRLCVAKVSISTDINTNREQITITQPSGAQVLFFRK